jgi:archaellum component FlaC
LYVPEEEDETSIYLDYDGDHPRVLELALEFRDAVRKYNRIKGTLELLNISLQNIDDAVNQLQEQVNQLEAEKRMVENSFDSLIERYSIAKSERILYSNYFGRKSK